MMSFFATSPGTTMEIQRSRALSIFSCTGDNAAVSVYLCADSASLQALQNVQGNSDSILATPIGFHSLLNF